MKSVIGKGVFKLSIILLACLMLSISLFGCVRKLETDDEFFDDGYFSFVKVYKNSKAIEYTGAGVDIDGDYAVMLLDLTEEGKKQKVIDVPDTINGLPVVSISPYYWLEVGNLYEMKNNYGHFESGNVEKMYINYSIKSIGSTNVFSAKNLKRIIINNQLFSYGYKNVNVSSNLIVVIHQNCSDNILNGVFGFITNAHDLNRIFEANIEYKYNYDTGTAQENYRIDLIKDKTETPYGFADPIRDGYTFGGWYLEPECVTIWDGNIQSLIDEVSGDIKFYTERNIDEDMPRTQTPKKEEYKNYISKTDKILRLYAKWIEN